jgi:hypothetical protein
VSTECEIAYEALRELLRASRGVPLRDKPLLWLGAGASTYDGVPAGDDLLLLLVGATGTWGSPQFRLDQRFDGLPPAARLALLEPHLTRPIKAASPYHTVIRLLVDGYLGGVVTFNVDDLLDQAIDAATAWAKIKVLDGVTMIPKAIGHHFFDSHRAQPIILKLHGSLETGLNLFTSAEISAYEPKLALIVESLSRRPAVVCGYSFAHLNLLRVFSTEKAPFYYCNPTSPCSPALLSVMVSRGGVIGRTLDGDRGRFDDVMSALAPDLT